MIRKTAGVEQLVKDVLETFSEPYGEDIIDDVCFAIEDNPEWMQRYSELGAELRSWVVNNWIGQYTKQLTGLKTVREVKAKRSKLISSYTKLTQSFRQVFQVFTQVAFYLFVRLGYQGEIFF